VSPEHAGLAGILTRLSDRGVDFVVIGGVAVVLHALPRFTKDLDLAYDPAPDNLEALADALQAIRPRLRGVDEDVPFVLDARTLRQTEILTLETDEGGIDLLRAPEGAPPYPQLRARAAVFDLEGREVRVAAIDDLVAMKRAAGRPQDLIDIAALEIALREAGEAPP
jgi:predicted nucleotidyltransferase